MKNVYFVLLLGIMVACNSQSNWLSDIPESDIDMASAIEWIDLPENMLLNPRQMLAIDDYIIIANDASTDVLMAYNMITGHDFTLLRRGRAENEVLSVNQLLNVDGNLGVVDVIGQKVLLIDLDTMQLLDSFEVGDFTAIYIQSDYMVGTLASKLARYAVRKCHSNEYSLTFGDYDEYNVTDEVGWRNFQGHLLANGEKIAWFGYYCGAMQIVKYTDGTTITSTHFEDFEHDDVMTEQMSLDRKINFISITANQEIIYTLYDGKDLNYYVEHRGARPCGNTICVFDWMGTAKSKIVYDNPIFNISYNKSDNYLYLCVMFSQLSEYKVARIKIEE